MNLLAVGSYGTLSVAILPAPRPLQLNAMTAQNPPDMIGTDVHR